MEVPVWTEGKRIGWLWIGKQESETLFDLRAAAEGPWRAVVWGSGGEMTLGVAEDGRLRRVFSDELTAGLGRLEGARLESLSAREETWQPAGEGYPSGSLRRRQHRGWLVAAPFQEREPFPMVQRFCMARICRRNGKEWAVFFLPDEKKTTKS